MKLISIFYQRVSEGYIRPKWMAKAYHDWIRSQEIFVLFPFHYLVMFAWWLNFKWCFYRSKPSWIDKQVIKAVRKINEDD